MKYFGWKSFEMPVGEPDAFQWVVRVEQLECFRDQDVEVDILGTEGYLDRVNSVSALAEAEGS